VPRCSGLEVTPLDLLDQRARLRQLTAEVVVDRDQVVTVAHATSPS
jgi:hypothetical protein